MAIIGAHQGAAPTRQKRTDHPMKLALNSLQTLATAGIPMIVGLISVPLYLHAIGAERYGALMIAWLLLGYFGQADFGIGRAITQRISAMRGAERASMAAAIWSALFSVLAFGLLGAALIYGAASYFFAGPFRVEESLRLELLDARWLLALCNPVVAVTGVAGGALMGLERFRSVSVGNLVSSLSSQILPLLVALQWSTDLQVLVAAALAGRLIGLVIIASDTWRTFLRHERISPSAAELKGLARFGSWIMVTALVGPLMTMADRFVIGAALGAVAVAAYAIPMGIALRTMILPMSVAQALFPRLASEEHERAAELSREAVVFLGQVYAPVVIGLNCLAAPLLHLWLGSQLDVRSIVIAQIVLTGFWTNAIANVPYALIQARGNPRFTALIHIAELPFYLVMLYAFGTVWGLAGVAAAFSLRCAIDCLILMLKGGLLRSRVLAGLVGPAFLVLVSLAAGQAFQAWMPALAAATVLCGATLLFALYQMPPGIRNKLSDLPFLQKIPLIFKLIGARRAS
jgi:O-antigen/teichoic acid export membrane protein